MIIDSCGKSNEKGHLQIGGCDTVELAKEFGTPLFVMDEECIRKKCKEFYQSFIEKYGNSQVVYASKAFLTLAIARIIEQEGLGLDVVSGGEIYTAMQADFPASRIYFHGNNKSRSELYFAVDIGIHRVVIDNYHEIELLNEVAKEKGIKQAVLIRVAPGIDAHTHEYIKTGQIDSKFGFTLSNGAALYAIKRALNMSNIDVKGIHCHIGSQIFELESYVHAVEVMLEFAQTIKKATGLEIEDLNIGGGFGIYYHTGDKPASIKDYANLVMKTVKEKSRNIGLSVPRVIIEPGRSIIGPAGTTLYTVGSIKEIPGVRKYVAVDGGMTDNIRPALYQAKYEAIIANKASKECTELVSIAGKCCESGDMLIWDAKLPAVQVGDILAVPATGAYGYSMASNYNKFCRPAVVLVHEGEAEIIVKRENYQDLIRNEIIPKRLK